MLRMSHPGGSGFEVMEGSWRADEAWHCERPGKDFDNAELNGTCREIEACHHEENSGEAIGEGATQLQ